MAQEDRTFRERDIDGKQAVISNRDVEIIAGDDNTDVMVNTPMNDPDITPIFTTKEITGFRVIRVGIS